MTISIEDIKKLRDSTGVSMTACKKALEEVDGDMEKAFDVLRKKGESKAQERSERSTANGAISVKVKDGKAVLLALQCETDFVSRADDFRGVLDSLSDKALNGEINSAEEELAEIKDAQLRLGENIKIGELKFLEAPVLGFYVHSNDKLASVVGLEGGDTELAKDLAMHASALNPKYLSPNDVDEDVLKKEYEIWSEQLKNEGKTEDIISKILLGKEKKFREENAFLTQAFVKNPEMTISQLLESKNAKLKSFVVYSI
jgi:elongation factor Ts